MIRAIAIEAIAAIVVGLSLIGFSVWLAWGSAALPLAVGSFDGPQYVKGEN